MAKKPTTADLKAAEEALQKILDDTLAENIALNKRTDLTAEQKAEAARKNHEKAMLARARIIGPLGAAPTGFTFYGQELLCTTGGYSFTGVMMERATLSHTGDNIRLKDAATGLTGSDIFRDAGDDVTLVGYIEATSGVSGFTRPAYGAAITINAVTYAVTNAQPEFSDGPARVTINATRKNSIASYS